MDESITLRLTKKEKESIKLLVRAGKYVSLSEFVRQSIRHLLGIENV